MKLIQQKKPFGMKSRVISIAELKEQTTTAAKYFSNILSNTTSSFRTAIAIGALIKTLV